jgi:hypothetical protein
LQLYFRLDAGIKNWSLNRQEQGSAPFNGHWEGKLMEQFLPLILSAVGGTVLGPIISKVAGGSGAGGIIGGIVGGIGGHFGADAAGLSGLMGSGFMGHIQSLLEGGVGGGVLGTVLGMVMKSRD